METINKYYVIIFLGGLLLGTGAGALFFTYSDRSSVPADNTYEAGWNAAKARLAESGIVTIPANAEVKTVSGSVTTLEVNGFSLKIRPLEPLADQKLDTRVIIVDQNTKFFVTKRKDSDTIEKEMADFMKKVATEEGRGSTPPEMFERIPATLQDIVIGKRATVSSITNIKDSPTITAVEVLID